MLDAEEYIEQAHFFGKLAEAIDDNRPLQDILTTLREEALATTKLPMAIDFLRSELLHAGGIGAGVDRLGHYFAPFQGYVVREAERDEGRFDLRVGLRILQHQADYRARGASTAGLFMFQLEALCRNRLSYDAGLEAVAQDPAFDDRWRDWIREVRRQIGLIDLADLIYLRSEYHEQRLAQRGERPAAMPATLFGVREGRIAWATRGKDPLLLFSALQRQLGYPTVPRTEPVDSTTQLIPQLVRRIERLETRLKLFEDEQQQGIDITKFYGPPESG